MSNVIPFPKIEWGLEEFTLYERDRIKEFNDALRQMSTLYGEGEWGVTDEGREWFSIPINREEYPVPVATFVKAPDGEVHLIAGVHNGFVDKDNPHVTGTVDEVIGVIAERRRNMAEIATGG